LYRLSIELLKQSREAARVLGSNPVKLESVRYLDVNSRKIIGKRCCQWFYPGIELLFWQLLCQLVYTGLPQSLTCVRAWRCRTMGRREIIQNMTILWISSILGVTEAGLSKIYPQNPKKQFIK
jgi:hypothetical protein